jgi:hypothetical protein
VQQRDSYAREYDASRLGISAIGELAAGHDEQIGKIFRNMRAALKVPREILARRLATTPSVIDSFEAGAITALPHWKEAERIVRSYCDLLRLDPEPVLWRLRSQLRALAAMSHPTVPTARSRSASARQAAPSEEAPPVRSGRRRRRGRALFVLSVPIALVAGVVYLEQAAPRSANRLLQRLPASIAEPVRAGFDRLVSFAAPSRDGLTWIEVSDPRSRKADKLQARAR